MIQIFILAVVALVVMAMKNSIADWGNQRTREQADLGRGVQLIGIILLAVVGIFIVGRLGEGSGKTKEVFIRDSPNAPGANIPVPVAPGSDIPVPTAPGANTPVPVAPGSNIPVPTAPGANTPVPVAPGSNIPVPKAPRA